MKYLFLLLTAMLAFLGNVNGQKYWTLESCIDYAYENNPTLKQRKLEIKNNQINVTEAKMSVLPSINAGINQGINYGRTIDPFTNQFVVSQINNAQFNLSSGTLLFNGFQIYNNIKSQQQSLLASKFDNEVAKNNLGLTIANAYLQVLFAKELLRVADERMKSILAQVERTEKFFAAGVANKDALLTINGQKASEALNRTQASNQVRLANLTLWQLLDLNPDENDVIVPEVDSITDLNVQNATQIYNAYALHAPELEAAKHRLEASDFTLKSSRGAFYPRLSFGANIYTIYSDNFRQASDYKTIGYQAFFAQPDLNTGIFEPISIPASFKVTPFNTQLKDNLGQTIGFSLNVPIFNNYRNVAAVKRASLSKENIRLGNETVRINLKNQITQAYNECLAAKESFQANKANYEAQKLSFENNQIRFEQKLISDIESSVFLSNYNQAQSNYLRSKYELLFRSKVIDFYLNGAIQRK
jgi:outer membrane protein